ncbi:ABC transporter permease [Treponema bryantii]|nr:ABC transporter permease subunit [Treponema bryantii]
MDQKRNNIFSRVLSPFLLLLIWYAVALIMKAPLILPYPHTVLVRLCELAGTALFWKSFCITLLRVILAFIISVLAGFCLGLLSADYKLFNSFLQFPLNVIRVTPIIAFILIALFWFKSGTVPVVIATVMSLPVMVTACEKGFERNAENIEKLFKANSYGFTGFYAFRYIRFPSALPAILSGAESSFGLCWKVVAAGEVLSVPRFAAGTLMQKAQVHLDTADVLAVTAVLVIVSSLCQWFLKILINKFSSKKGEKAL